MDDKSSTTTYGGRKTTGSSVTAQELRYILYENLYVFGKGPNIISFLSENVYKNKIVTLI